MMIYSVKLVDYNMEDIPGSSDKIVKVKFQILRDGVPITLERGDPPVVVDSMHHEFWLSSDPENLKLEMVDKIEHIIEEDYLRLDRDRALDKLQAIRTVLENWSLELP